MTACWIKSRLLLKIQWREHHCLYEHGGYTVQDSESLVHYYAEKCIFAQKYLTKVGYNKHFLTSKVCIIQKNLKYFHSIFLWCYKLIR
jgi:hypothetical protein